MKKSLVRSKVLSAMLAASLTTTSFAGYGLTIPAIHVEAASDEGVINALYKGSDYYTSQYDAANKYDGTDLGCTYTKEKTTFKVWSPEATKVTLKRYATGSDSEEGAKDLGTVEMTKGEKGVWSCTVEGDIVNTYYTYDTVVGGTTYSNAVDIYAKAVGVNGDRAMVVDLDSTDPENWDKDYDSKRTAMKLSDISVWEVHIRDFSIDVSSGVSEENRGKYKAFTETGTTINGEGRVKTCVDYLKQLGVTHVQLLPMYDYASVDETKVSNKLGSNYNWGYDPENYNAPEGSYSSNPYDGNVRIKEMKEMIQALHDAGIKVIMDVVYNHTYETKNSNFTKLMPDYYYKLNGTKYNNQSGCGNATRSQAAMYSKFMRESLLYWAEEYHIDGFRFDLMGIHDYNTMNNIRKDMDERFGEDTIILYGEGWTGDGNYDTDSAHKANESKLAPDIGYFNDQIRDSIKGEHKFDGTIGLVQHNYVTGTDLEPGEKWPNNVFGGIMASVGYTEGQWGMWRPFWSKSSNSVLSYCSAHDNLTLWDKLTEGFGKNYSSTDEKLIKMNKMAGAVTLVSHGGYFLQAGEEFARTKGGDENSYSSPDSTNKIDWTRVSTYSDIQQYYQGMLAIRKAFSGFRNEWTRSSDNWKPNNCNLTWISKEATGTTAFYLTNDVKGEWNKLAVIINNATADVTVDLTGSNNWVVIADGKNAGLTKLSESGSSLKVAGKSVVVAVPKDTFDANPNIGKKNTAPEIVIENTKIAAKTGDKVEFTVSASDAEGDAVTISAEMLPKSADFDAATGKFTWDSVAEGTTTVTFTATDGTDKSSKVVTITGTSATTALNVLLKEIEEAELTQENTGTTDELWTNFSNEIAKAQELTKKTDATEAECNAAETSLKVAFIIAKNTKSAKEILDVTKAKAETKITTAKADSINYDAEALQDAETVLETAKALTKATPDDYTDMNEDVEDTLDTLVSKKACPKVHVSTTWDTPHVYIWTSVGTGATATATNYAGAWPGTELTDKDADGNYVFELEEDISYNVIVNNGAKGKKQTADLTKLKGDIYITVGAESTSSKNGNDIYPATTECKEIQGGGTAKVNTTKLAARIAVEKEKKAEDYEAASFQALQDAIAASEAVVADTATTQVKVNQQYRALKAASKALVFTGTATPTPDVTEVPTPKVTVSPFVTITPLVTVTPSGDVTAVPVTTVPSGDVTAAPATKVPDVDITNTPSITDIPNETNNPDKTSKPNETNQPSVNTPTPTLKPSADVTSTPGVTAMPNPTATVIPTADVEPTETPEPVLGVKSLTILAPQKKGIKNKYTFYATAKNGEAGYKYKFVLNEGMSGEKVIKSYSQKASKTWIPKKAGTYKITVYVKDASGDVASKEMFFSVAKKQLFVKSFKVVSKTLKVNKTFKAAVAAGNAKGTAYYKFIVKNSKNKTVSTRQYAKTKTFTWKPTAKGKYKITVYVKDKRNTYIKSTKTVTVK